MLGFMDTVVISEIVDRALAEDVGSGDVTTAATVPPYAGAEAVITQKAPGVIYGLDVAEQVFRELDPTCRSRVWLRREPGAKAARCCASPAARRRC